MRVSIHMMVTPNDLMLSPMIVNMVRSQALSASVLHGSLEVPGIWLVLTIHINCIQSSTLDSFSQAMHRTLFYHDVFSMAVPKQVRL